jgi:hypothetical protein
LERAMSALGVMDAALDIIIVIIIIIKNNNNNNNNNNNAGHGSRPV